MGNHQGFKTILSLLYIAFRFGLFTAVTQTPSGYTNSCPGGVNHSAGDTR